MARHSLRHHDTLIVGPRQQHVRARASESQPYFTRCVSGGILGNAGGLACQSVGGQRGWWLIRPGPDNEGTLAVVWTIRRLELVYYSTKVVGTIRMGKGDERAAQGAITRKHKRTPPGHM